MLVRMRDQNLVRRGSLPVMSAKVALRNCRVSAWQINVNGNDPRWERFMEGWGVSIVDQGQVLISGPAIQIDEEENESGVRDVTISGSSDLVYLADSLIVPNPKDPLAQVNQWTATGKAETVIRKLIEEQIGPKAPDSYRIRHLDLEPDKGRGVEISVSERWSNLLEIVAKHAQASSLVFDVEQRGQRLVFTVREPVDRTRAVRLTRLNGGVSNYKLSRQAPESTEVIVGGTGSGATRKMWREVAKDSGWHRRVTTFLDRPSTSKDMELKQAAESELEQRGPKSSVTFEATETETTRFKDRWDLGDKISVDLGGGAVIRDQAQIVEIEWGPNGRKLKVQVGPEPDETKLNQSSSKLVELVKSLSAQLRHQQTK